MPGESDQQNFLARRVYNRRPRYYGLTLPQWGALGAALALGGLLWWVAGVLPVFSGPSLEAFGLRLLGPGALAGALGVLFYALADDLREPVLRQSLYFVLCGVLQRHTYRKEPYRDDTPRRAGRGGTAAAGRLWQLGGSASAHLRALRVAAARAVAASSGLGGWTRRRRP